MTRQTLIKARFATTRRDLDKIITRLTPELMEWAPAEGMRTVAGQLIEVIGVELPLVPLLKTGNLISDADIDSRTGDNPDLNSLRRLLVTVREETLGYLDSLSESDLAEEVPCTERWFGSLWLPIMPRAEFFLNVIENELYHVGQLTSYLWCKGDNPYHNKW